MEKQAYPQQQGRFLPYYFKYIGRGVGLLGLILFFSKLVVDVVNPYIGFGLMLTGIFLFAFSKEKIENENLMKKSQQLYQRGLQPPFPNYFKKIGAGLVLFAIFILMPAIIWLKRFNIGST